jgi:hypothetical protein
MSKTITDLKEVVSIKSPNLRSVKELNTKASLLLKLKHYFQYLISNVQNHKKKVIFMTIGVAIFYYVYKKYLSPKIQIMMEFYSKFSEYKDILMNNGSNFDEVLQQYEPCFNNLIKKLLAEVKNKLNNVSNLEQLYNNLKNSKKDEMLANWTNFKNKVLTYHLTSAIVVRFLITISQTHLLILEKLQINGQKVPKNICDDLLTELWILANAFTDNLILEIQTILEEPLNKIPISNSYNWSAYLSEMNNFQEKLQDLYFDNFNNQIKLSIFKGYVTEVAKKIEILENNTYNNDVRAYKTEVFLKFYQIYFDIVNSNLFHVIIYKAINNDLSIIEKDIKIRFNTLIKEEIKQINNNNSALNKNINPEEIEKNANNNPDDMSTNSLDLANHSLKLIKIIIMMLKIDGLILDTQSSHFVNKLDIVDNKFQEELNEYFKIIYD